MYNIALAWVLIGTMVYVIHNTYVWNVASDSFKNEIVTFKFFLASVIVFPIPLFACIYIAVSTEIAFRKWKRENFN